MTRVQARRSLSFAILLVAVLAASCSNPEPAVWPDLGADDLFSGDPVRIDISMFDAVPGAIFDPHDTVGPGDSPAINRLFEQRQAGSVLERHYPNATLYDGDAPLSNGVKVLFVEEDDQFFLLEDHMAGHFDSPIGPFRGDPRELLLAAAGT
ncbi:MAG: hypothetical protein OEU32_03370 [Acidimicrobiia bacterium]|nr:hypothetical protein [Acidimicrobiia bacterium]